MKHLIILIVLVTSLGFAQHNVQTPGSYGNRINQQNAGDSGNETSGLIGNRYNGHAAGEQFGTCTVGAGDLNADGYPDIAISAFAYGNNKGRVYIYLGSNDVDKNEDVVISGESEGDRFGFSLSSAGDFNGDGFDDLLVGAYNYATTGKAYLYLGGSKFDNFPDAVFLNNSPNSFFGTSVACAGDVNGDGYSDIIVGANGNNSNNGTAYIYFGGSVINPDADIIIDGTAASFFGSTVAGIKDMNGDGYDDVVIGEYPFSTNDGRAFVFLGGSSMDTVSDLTLTGNSDQKLSRSIAGGDVNGDGYSDLIIGCPGAASSFGLVIIYYGSASLDSQSDQLLYPESSATAGSFGFSIAAADINGDCFDDVIVGAYTNNTATGKVYGFCGGTVMDSYADMMYIGSSANSYFGCAVANAGDLNDDGFDEIIAGATGFNSNRGEAILLQNRIDGYDSPDIIIPGSPYDYCNAGDVNGDGYNDLLILYSTGFSLYYLGPNMVTTPAATANGTFGTMYSAGDVNGDGYDDVLLTDYSSGSNSGAAYLFLGSENFDFTVDLTFIGTDSAKLGYDVTALDYNNDGYSDLAISSPNAKNSTYTSSRTGNVKIFYGGANIDNIHDVLFEGYDHNSQFGASIANAGDIDHSGRESIIIGIPGGTGTGRATLYDAYYSLQGEASGNNFGSLVAGGGDFNGDGFNDFAVSAPNFGAASSYQGRIYIYFGGTNLDAAADLSITGYTYSNIGYCDIAGDINGDGFDDLIASTPAGSFGIYFGGREMDNQPDVFFSYFPIPIGDINNDGFDDLVCYPSVLTGAGTGIYLSSPPPAKPRIMRIEDVPFDEGGQLNIKFARSGFDMPGNGAVTNYIVQRSAAPGLQGYFWENIEEVTPIGMKRYLVTIDTQADSLNTFYRVIAQTADEDYYWVSNIVAAQSIDNISPSAVRMFRGSFGGNSVTLNWNENREEDLFGYYIYRSPVAFINPDEVSPLAIVHDTLFIDSNPPSGSLFYFIRAKDIHGNFSPLISASNNPLPVELSAFTASVSDYNVTLNWQTITEVDNYGFQVERAIINAPSPDGGQEVKITDWLSLGFVAGAGYSNSPRSYSFTDKNVFEGTYNYRLKQIDNIGNYKYSDIVEITVNHHSLSFELFQNYPNPFNPATKIMFNIPSEDQVEIKVFNALGLEIATLLNEKMPGGAHSIEFNAENLSSGIYFYRIISGKYSETKKMILLR